MGFYFLGEWTWLLAFIPLYFVVAPLLFWLGMRIKSALGDRAGFPVDAATVVLNLGIALVPLSWGHCSEMIDLPLLDPMCRMF